MAVGLNRATIIAIRKEVNSGDYLKPSAATQFIPVRPGSSLSFEPEKLESDELLNDIGASKSAVGKESLSGSQPNYIRHSGIEGQEPQTGILYESILGTKYVMATEYDTVSSSTTKILKVGSGEGAQFRVGQAVLVKDGTNGYSIRNITAINVDDLHLNFALAVAPLSGVNLGKAVAYIPAAQGHPSFSITKYLGSGHAIEAAAGCTVTELSITADANGYAEAEFSFEGTKYLFNPIEITATNKFIDFTDDQGTFAASVPENLYRTPIELAEAIQAALESASAETFTVSYSNETGKFKIESGSAVLSLLWQSGTNAANSIGTTIGFLVASDDTGAVSYESDNGLSYAAAYVPSYDNADSIIVKGAELFVGDVDQNVCICAQSVSLSISKESEDVDCICEESGVSEKVPTSRSAEMTFTATLKKNDASLLDALLKNKTISAMLNAGPKQGGNWKAGACVNFALGNCTVSNYTHEGDNFIQVNVTLSGFVTSTLKDIYINFV